MQPTGATFPSRRFEKRARRKHVFVSRTVSGVQTRTRHEGSNTTLSNTKRCNQPRSSLTTQNTGRIPHGQTKTGCHETASTGVPQQPDPISYNIHYTTSLTARRAAAPPHKQFHPSTLNLQVLGWPSTVSTGFCPFPGGAGFGLTKSCGLCWPECPQLSAQQSGTKT